MGADVRSIADNVMQILLLVISNASKNSTVMEDAFLAVGALTTATEADFARYMESFAPFLLAGLQTYEEHQMCCIAIGLVGDICRALNEGVVMYCETFVQTIGTLLQNPQAHRSIKPACLSCIGDIALAIGGKFEVYLHPVMMAIGGLATSLESVPQATTEQYDYVCQMQEGIAEAYVGIAQGLKAADKGIFLYKTGMLMMNYAAHIFQFLQFAASIEDRPEFVTRSLVGLVGYLNNHTGTSRTHIRLGSSSRSSRLNGSTRC